MTSLIIGLGITMIFSAFFSGMEIAFVSSNRLRAEMDREKGGLSQRAIELFYRHPNNFVSTMLVGNNIALVVYGILMAKIVNALILIPSGIHHSDGNCPNEALCLFLQTILATFITLSAFATELPPNF